MKPFTKGALVSALWWVPIGIVLALALQAAAVMLFGYLIASGNGPDWLRGMGLQEVKFHSIDSERDHGPFDYDWTVRTLDGVEVPMEEFRGKVIFLNQWATWCMPCVMEMPSIDKLYSSIDPQEVAFVLVTDEDAEEVRDFLDGKEWPARASRTQRSSTRKAGSAIHTEAPGITTRILHASFCAR